MAIDSTSFREVLKLVYDPRGLTGGLGKARESARDTRASLDAVGRAVGAAAAAGALFVGNIARQHEDARVAIARTTGKTGDELDRLQAAYLSTLGSVRSSSQATAETVAILTKLAGASGPILEAAAIAVERAKEGFGSFDVSQLQGSMSAFNRTAADTPGVLDAVGTIAQSTGVPIGKLVGVLQSYGPVLKNLGLSMEESVSLFASF